MAYNTTEAVAKFLSGFQMKITNRERDTVAPDYYVKYSLTLSKGGKDFSTTFVSDGEPTVTQVFSALADDALTLRKYSTDEFVDKLYAQGVKPSAALRAYDSCKETNLWMQDELYLSGWEIEEISKTLTKYEDEVNTLVEKAASERAVRYAYDHPKLPKGFVTIEQLQGDLDLGDLRGHERATAHGRLRCNGGRVFRCHYGKGLHNPYAHPSPYLPADALSARGS